MKFIYNNRQQLRRKTKEIVVDLGLSFLKEKIKNKFSKKKKLIKKKFRNGKCENIENLTESEISEKSSENFN